MTLLPTSGDSEALARARLRAALLASVGRHSRLELFLHEPANFELDRTLRRDVHALKRLGVLGSPSSSLFRLEHAELAKLQAIAAAKLRDDGIQKALDDLLDHDALVPALVGHSIYQFLLGYRVHERILDGKSP